ncbi:hypothetical protein FHT03_000042 [Xanthomonas arboricola]
MGNELIKKPTAQSSTALALCKPREIVGRDTISRFQAQFRGAALEALRILEGKGVEAVYCDLYDDYVVRQSLHGQIRYHFVQVKTNSPKHQWSRLQLFGIPKKLPKFRFKNTLLPGGSIMEPANQEEIEKLKSSFIGKLLQHAVMFGDACASVTFATNAHLGDEVEAIGAAIAIGVRDEPTTQFIVDNFKQVFPAAISMTPSEIYASFRKLQFSHELQHLHPQYKDFDSHAIKAIWKYSEITLTIPEGRGLTEKLLMLIAEKSCSRLPVNVTQAQLDSLTAVTLDDLLNLLPISREAYHQLLNGGDTYALKNASILQRKLKSSGATQQMIDVACKWKVQWDNWFRKERHYYEAELEYLREDLNRIYARLAGGEIRFRDIESEVSALKLKLQLQSYANTLTNEILLGGVLAELVRGESA